MADMSVKALNTINPFIVAASPATQGVASILRTADTRPGAVVMRNYGHGAGGGNLLIPSAKELREGQDAAQSHALGEKAADGFASLDAYCEAVSEVRRRMPADVRLWVSVGHYGDTVKPGVDWERLWAEQAAELERAGADALEVHFNTPGVAAARGRVYDFNRLIYNTTRMIAQATSLPVMVKLPLEGCDPLRAMESAVHAGADAVGPTARWKAFVFDLDWRRSQAPAGSGYGGSQALPIICYAVAEARQHGLSTPMFAGGGVFSWTAAAKLIMAGSQCVQLGTLACCLGPRAVARVIEEFGTWLEGSDYGCVDELCGQALNLFSLSDEVSSERERRLGAAYRETPVDADTCVGCGACAEVCWFDAIALADGRATKGEKCIGCGYCFQVCPTGALHVPAGDILASAFPEAGEGGNRRPGAAETS